MKQMIWLCFSFLFLQNCNEPINKTLTLKEDATAEVHPGKQLLEVHCYACHNPTASHDNRLAPPMMAVKNHYLSDGISKEEFISDIQNWVNNPKADNARMRGAVKRFGVMPKQPFPEETIRQIADYIYSSELERPNCSEEQKGSQKRKQMRQL